MRRYVLTLTLLALLLVLPAAAQAGEPPAGSKWEETYFDSSVGRLHADVLLPEGQEGPFPVVLTVSPYTNHSEDGNRGPSSRFFDFVNGAKLFERGYAYVIVDLPGTGGSGGCWDWGGPRERGGTKAAVEWAAQQPWSTGKVALFGKSYDGWTGLMGIAEQPEGLAAVISMEPVFAGYNYLYNNRVRFSNSLLTPVSFTQHDLAQGASDDTQEYTINSNRAEVDYPGCHVYEPTLQQLEDPNSNYWRARNLLLAVRGADTPLFLTQGYLESNTKPDAAFDFWNLLDGEDNRAWFGMFNHFRGYEQVASGPNAGRYYTGRDTFLDEAVEFLDQHLKGGKETKEPAVEVQQGPDGRWRAEEAWPPADMRMFKTPLTAGTYDDDGSNRGTGSGSGTGIWTVSAPLTRSVHLAGEPVVEAVVQSTPRANFVGNVSDIDPDGKAVLLSRGTTMLNGSDPITGPERVQLPLYGNDWVIEKGHRIGVLVSGANSEWWVHVPTMAPITVQSATIALPLLTKERDKFIEGGSTPDLESHLKKTVTVPAGAGEAAFKLPARKRAAKKRRQTRLK